MVTIVVATEPTGVVDSASDVPILFGAEPEPDVKLADAAGLAPDVFSVPGLELAIGVPGPSHGMVTVLRPPSDAVLMLVQVLADGVAESGVGPVIGVDSEPVFETLVLELGVPEASHGTLIVVIPPSDPVLTL